MKPYRPTTVTMAFFLIFQVVLFLPAASFAQSRANESRELFVQGNLAYSQGKYIQAINLYEQIRANEGQSSFLLHNLANSYAQAGKPGQAILNYKRALLLSPGDSDIQGNLELVRQNQGLFQEEPSLGARYVNSLGLNQWTLLGLACLLLLTLIQVAGLRFSLGKQLKFWLNGGALFLLVISLFAAFAQYGHYHSAVVVSPDVRLLISPFPTASSTGILQEGRLVIPLKQHGNFFLVEDETGRSGWIDGPTMEFITTPHPSLAQ